MLIQTLALVFSLTSLTSSSPIIKRAFSNGPVITENFPDPSFIEVDGTYYAFATTNGKANIPVATSRDFVTWTVTGGDALPNIPSWSSGQTWAPDVVQLADGSFVMYFAAATTTDMTKHCVGTATASNVEGPYKASDTVFACPLSQGGAIDPAGFADSDGTLYVVYKIDGNSLGGGGPCGNKDGSHSTAIMLQKLNRDGVTPNGAPVSILDRSHNDGPLIEAPSLVNSGGSYVLFFSSNCYNTPLYDTSYATASAVAGPYTKALKPNAPLLTSGGDGGRLNSPGGTDVSPAGDKIVFHADSVAGDSSVRQMWTAGINIAGGVVTIS